MSGSQRFSLRSRGKTDQLLYKLMTRQCIFCGSGQLTKEDAFPKWLVQLLRSQQPSGSEPAIHRREAGPDGSIKSHESSSGSFTQVRQVCGECNNGWMSRLEEQAKEIMAPVIESLEHTQISTSDLVVIARWAIKTAFVYEFTRPTVRSSAPESRRVLARSDSLLLPNIPPFYYVSIGALATPNSMPLRAGWVQAKLGGSGDPTHMSCALFMGHLVLHVWGGIAEIDGLQSRVLPGKLQRIWPPSTSSVSWPPRTLLLEEETTLIAGYPFGTTPMRGWG